MISKLYDAVPCFEATLNESISEPTVQSVSVSDHSAAPSLSPRRQHAISGPSNIRSRGSACFDLLAVNDQAKRE